MNMRAVSYGKAALLPALAVLGAWAATSCNNGVDPVDLSATPSAPANFQIYNGTNSVVLRWDFLDQVSPTVSFSGYKVYMAREGWDDGYQPWTQFQTRPDSPGYLPLLKRENSFSDSYMEIIVVGLTNGALHSFYVVGVQNGNEGPPSEILEDVPYRLNSNIGMREASEDLPDYYMLGYARATEHLPACDRVGYLRDPQTGTDYLHFVAQSEGGWLRFQNAGKDAATDDAPVDGSGTPVGYLDDPGADRIEVTVGDYVFVWNTNGTDGFAEDDHFARLYIERFLCSQSKMHFSCAYQPRPNTPNL